MNVNTVAYYEGCIIENRQAVTQSVCAERFIGSRSTGQDIHCLYHYRDCEWQYWEYVFVTLFSVRLIMSTISLTSISILPLSIFTRNSEQYRPNISLHFNPQPTPFIVTKYSHTIQLHILSVDTAI